MMILLLIFGCQDSNLIGFDDSWPEYCPFTETELLELAQIVEVPNTTDAFKIVREVDDLRVTAWTAELQRFRFDLDENTLEGLDELLLNSWLWHQYPEDVPSVEGIDLVGCDWMGWRGQASIVLEVNGMVLELAGPLIAIDMDAAYLETDDGRVEFSASVSGERWAA